MPIALVQSKANGVIASSASVTLDAAPTDGNLLVAVVSTNIEVSASTTMAESGWNVAAFQTRLTGSSRAIKVFYKIAASASATQTANSTGAASTDLHVYEVSGIDTSSPLDQIATGQGAAASVTSCSTGTTPTTTAVDEFLVAGVAIGGGTSGGGVSWTNSFTPQFDTIRLLSSTRIVSATGTYETTASWTSARSAAGALCTFKAAAVAHTRTVTDVESLTDAVSAVQTHPRTVTDAEGLTDVAAPVAVYARALTDSEALTDLVAYEASVTVDVTVTDALGLTDLVSFLKSQVVLLTDAMTVTDRVRWLQTTNRAAGCAVEDPTSRAVAVADPTSRNCPAPSVGPYGNRRNP